MSKKNRNCSVKFVKMVTKVWTLERAIFNINVSSSIWEIMIPATLFIKNMWISIKSLFEGVIGNFCIHCGNFSGQTLHFCENLPFECLVKWIVIQGSASLFAMKILTNILFAVPSQIFWYHIFLPSKKDATHLQWPNRVFHLPYTGANVAFLFSFSLVLKISLERVTFRFKPVMLF